MAVPPWMAAMDATMARPSPKPSREVRSVTGPVLATVSWLRGVLANASHELRTPLAVMRATVDVVLDKPDNTSRFY